MFIIFSNSECLHVKLGIQKERGKVTSDDMKLILMNNFGCYIDSIEISEWVYAIKYQK